MLILKEPIQLKNRSPVRGSYAGFGERIRHNYTMMNVPVEAEDLLHLVTMPPEVYLGDGGVTNLFSLADVKNGQEWKLEMINNVVNRILVSEEQANTYQDTVYISSMLRKLGIRDDRKFMKQVQELRQETRNTQELINLYWNYAQELGEIITSVKEGRALAGEGQKEEREQASGSRYYLQDSIYSRLQTAEIYRLQKTFSRYHSEGSERIGRAELLIAEQGRLAERMLLQKLKTVVLQERSQQLYHHMNLYERGEEITYERVSERTVLEEMAAAVLLNMVDNVYQLRADDPKQETNVWYSLTENFYRSADNTLSRYESYHREIRAAGDELHTYLSRINRHEQEEIQVLNQFIDAAIPLYYGYTLPSGEEETQKILRRIEHVTERKLLPDITDSETAGRDIIYRNTPEYPQKGERDRTIERQYERTDVYRVEPDSDKPDGLRRIEHVTERKLLPDITDSETAGRDIIYRNAPEYPQKGERDRTIERQYERTDVYRVEPDSDKQDGVSLQRREWYENGQEINRYDRTYDENTYLLQEPYAVDEGNEGKSRAELYFESYEEQTAYYEEQNRLIREQLVQLEESAPKIKTIRVDRERARRDSLRALEDPEALLREYLERPPEGVDLVNRTQDRYEHLMTEETKDIFRRLEEYSRAPEEAVRSGLITTGAEGLLQAEMEEAQKYPMHLPGVDVVEDRPMYGEEIMPQTQHLETQRVYLDREGDRYDNTADNRTVEAAGLRDRNAQAVEDIYVTRLLKAADARLIFAEGAPVSEPQQRMAEIIDGVDKVLHIYRSEAAEDTLEEVKMVHKRVEQELDEETIQELIHQNTRQQTQQISNETVVKQDVMRETIQTSFSKEMVSQSTGNVEELVQKKLRQEMAAISEQVYRKLEQRLRNEQSRRGY